jgi:fatty-acid desaturase
MLYAWFGWIYYEYATDWEWVQPHLLYPELVFLNNFDVIPRILLAALVQQYFGTPRAFYWFILPCFASCVFTLRFNIENHPFRKETRKVRCTAIDHGLLADLVGERYHEHHHRVPYAAARPGIDLPYWLFLMPLQKLGLIWECA